MKLLVTLLVIVAVLFGVYHFTIAVYGWFEMLSVVNQTARSEIPGLVDRQQQGGLAVLDTRDRYVKLRDAIMKSALEANVPLHAENVTINVADNMLDVQLSWDAPLAVYQGKAYLQIPMTLQRTYPLTRRP
jgi:hypothetical protein